MLIKQLFYYQPSSAKKKHIKSQKILTLAEKQSAPTLNRPVCSRAVVSVASFCLAELLPCRGTVMFRSCNSLTGECTQKRERQTTNRHSSHGKRERKKASINGMPNARAHSAGCNDITFLLSIVQYCIVTRVHSMQKKTTNWPRGRGRRTSRAL